MNGIDQNYKCWRWHGEKEHTPPIIDNMDEDDYEFKRKGVPAKVLWYFPIIPRFKRLFANVEEAKNLRWHTEERKSDGQLRHPADSTQWINFDDQFPDFGSDGRNLRLALSTDGMNPHVNQSSTHSTWPVLLVIYNLPPWLCMKRKYMMLSLLISGPRQPGNDIDVYLPPLLEDFKLLWDQGVEVYRNEVADNNGVYRNEIHHAVGERTQVLQDVAADPTLPRTKTVRCTQCNHGEAVFFQATSRGEEGMTLFFVCCNPNCGHRWRD